MGNLMRLHSLLYEPSGYIGSACDIPIGYTGLGVWGHLLREGNTSSEVGGLLFLRFVSGHGEWGQGDLHVKILCLRRGHPRSAGGIGLVQS